MVIMIYMYFTYDYTPTILKLVKEITPYAYED